MDKTEIRDAYDRLAPWFDLLEGVPEYLLGTWRLRRELLAAAEGRVLEVAVGTGRNLPYYPAGCRIVGVDLSSGMLDRARRKASRRRRVRLARMDTEALAFADATFDTVVDSLTLCTYPDPVGALHEMARVCRPEGRMLLLEHGRSDRGWLAGWQDRHQRWLADRAGCHWNREPRRLVEQAGLPVRRARRSVLGVYHVIEVERPGWYAGPEGASRR